MSVLDALRALLNKMAPSASAASIVEALNKIGEAEGSQAVAAHDVAAAVQRISDAYTPPTPPPPTFEGMYVLYVLAHPSWNPSPEVPSEGAGLDVDISLFRLAGEAAGMFRWQDSAIDQPSNIDWDILLAGFTDRLNDLPLVVVAAIYGSDATHCVSAVSWPPEMEGSEGWATPYTPYVEYDVNGRARMRVSLNYDADSHGYDVTINADVESPVG